MSTEDVEAALQGEGAEGVPLLLLGNAPDLAEERGETSTAQNYTVDELAAAFQDLDTSEVLLLSVHPKDTAEIQRLLRLVDPQLHEAALAQDETAMRSLIAAGASLAALDHLGRTALHVCVAEKLIMPLEVLLSYDGATEVKDASGWPLLHAAIAHRWIEGVRLLMAAGADLSYHLPWRNNVLFLMTKRYPLIRGSEFKSLTETAIHLAVDIGELAMLDCVLEVAEERGVVDCLNSNGQTPLYKAIENENLIVIKSLERRGAGIIVSNKNETVLHVAARTPHILEYFLKTPGLMIHDDFGFAPIHRAVTYRQPKSIYLIIGRFGDNCLRMKTTTTCVEYPEMTPLHIAAQLNDEGSFKVAEVILELNKDVINEIDARGDTPLHTAAERNNRELAAMLLRKGAVLSSKGWQEKTAIQSIALHFDDASEFFEQVFDGFIFNTEYTNKVEVDVQYKVLTQKDSMSQINAVEEFVKSNQSKMLLHPYIEILLYLQWRRLLWFFCTMVGVFVVYLIILNLFVLNIFYQEGSSNSTSQVKTAIFEVYGGWYWFCAIFLYICIIILLLQELFNMYVRKLSYFLHLESWMKLFGLTLGALAPAVSTESGWGRHVACAAVLLCWLQAMFLLARVPDWGDYVFMFGTVATNMLKIFISTIFIVIGFSSCFMIQYHSSEPFDNPFNAFVKTLVMMSSEFDYGDLFGKDHKAELKNTSSFVRIIFVFFMVLVAIVLMNFMIGVAVSDISELNTTGNVRRLEKQLELISNMETFIYDGYLPTIIKKIRNVSIKRKYFTGFTFVLGRKTNNRVLGHVNNDGKLRDYVIPSNLLKAIIEISIKKLQQRDRHDSKSTRKYKIDALYDAIVDRPVKMDARTDSRRKNDSSWLRDVISNQNEQMRLLSHANDQIVRSIVDLKGQMVSLSRSNEMMTRSVEDLKAQIRFLSHGNTHIANSVADMKLEISHLKSNLASLKMSNSEQT